MTENAPTHWVWEIRPRLAVTPTSLLSVGFCNAALDATFEHSRHSCTLWNCANEPEPIVKLTS